MKTYTISLNYYSGRPRYIVHQKSTCWAYDDTYISAFDTEAEAAEAVQKLCAYKTRELVCGVECN
jgi:hypothetical protein